MKTKTCPGTIRVLLAAFAIIATGTSLTWAVGLNTQTTKDNPFDSIINRVMYYNEPITFEDFYPMFEVKFNNLKNYAPVPTEGCTILEIYNVTKNKAVPFQPTLIAIDPDGDNYMPEYYSGGLYPMSLVIVSVSTWTGTSLITNVTDGDALRIRFKVPNDAEYESPVFELYAPYYYDPEILGSQEYHWD